MRRKKGYDYYAMFMRMGQYTYEVAKELADIIENFDVEKLPQAMESMHKKEYKADTEVHDMMKNLAKEFVPPIEREDIILLAQELDEVIDSTEDILLRLYMYNIREIREEAIEFADIIVRGCEKIKDMMKEFPNFRKSNNIHDFIVSINQIEEEGDRFYINAVRNLYIEPTDIMDVIVWTRIFQVFEDCCDACEDVAETVEGIIMKNI
ncbi:hypothetical protein EDD65_10668 [Keratinibaculum paraultunense]|uniref:Phosphate transport regulator n=1 Tax=Keratinibaculum paraultunense TaxID=1278232 RepID=A0A4R3KVW8_9FIRM|nr:DUF47 family protein [Keratinibaculum paraultunense]QQY79270.1 DUF47 family protein [Keratinibaculum paraultunense]TCS89402.1 hypothetical protein EDD65_10668 [Keratinibaculum paraultunense]